MYRFIKEIRNKFHITNKDIEKIESEYNFKFPAKLRDYYFNHNGDGIELCRFKVDGYDYEVAKIVQIKYGSANFEHIVENDRDDKIIDINLLPLARNEGGDYFYWDIKSEKVYFYYCDDIENPIYICESLEKFFELMENGC